MEILDNSVAGSESSSLTTAMKTYLTETAKWGRFLSIVGFVGIALIAIAAFSIGSVMAMLPQLTGQAQMFTGAMGTVITLFYLSFAVLWFFPVWYLFKFSTGTLKSIPSLDITGIETALGNLKSLFKFYGVFTIIILSFYGFMLFIGLLAVFAR